MASEAQPTSTRSDRGLIPDLRGITLEQLARRAANGEEDVADVVSRIVPSQESASSLPAMMFHSAI